RTRDFITALAFSPDGREIAALAANEPFPALALFDVTTGKRTRLLQVPEAQKSRTSSIAFSPDGTKLVWGESDGSLALWDLADGSLCSREKLLSGEVGPVVSPPGGDLVAASGGRSEVHLRQAANLAEPVRQIEIGGPKSNTGTKEVGG